MIATTWFLIVFRFGPVPMDSEVACRTAMKQLYTNGAFCVNTKTGNVIKVIQ